LWIFVFLWIPLRDPALKGFIFFSVARWCALVFLSRLAREPVLVTQHVGYGLDFSLAEPCRNRIYHLVSRIGFEGNRVEVRWNREIWQY